MVPYILLSLKSTACCGENGCAGKDAKRVDATAGRFYKIFEKEKTMNETNERPKEEIDADVNRRVWHALVCIGLFCLELVLYASAANTFFAFVMPEIGSDALQLHLSYYLFDFVCCFVSVGLGVCCSCLRRHLRKGVDIQSNSMFDTMENTFGLLTIVAFMSAQSDSVFPGVFAIFLAAIQIVMTARLPEEFSRSNARLYTHIFIVFLYILVAALCEHEGNWAMEIFCMEVIVYFVWRSNETPFPPGSHKRAIFPRPSIYPFLFALSKENELKPYKSPRKSEAVELKGSNQETLRVFFLDKIRFENRDYLLFIPEEDEEDMAYRVMIMRREADKHDDWWRMTEVCERELYMTLYKRFMEENEGRFWFEDELDEDEAAPTREAPNEAEAETAAPESAEAEAEATTETEADAPETVVEAETEAECPEAEVEADAPEAEAEAKDEAPEPEAEEAGT